MSCRKLLIALAFVPLALPPAEAQQQEKRLTAREIFYASSAPTPAKPAARKTTPAQAAPAQSAKPKPTPKPPQVVDQTPPQPQAQPKTDTEVPAAPVEVPVRAEPTAPDGTEITTVAESRVSADPLGLRYSVVKLNSGQPVEVSPQTIFHSGDSIRLTIQVNRAGYLYVISRGSSGTWKPLFPSSENNVPNRVNPGEMYNVPSGFKWTFDENRGEEKLFIVLSRTPEPNLENLVHDVRKDVKPAPVATPKRPDSPSRKEPPPQTYMAMNFGPMDDSAVGKLRELYSRDLIVEKVDSSTPAEPGVASDKKEAAVYVVNPNGGSDTRLVADVTLTHQ